MKKNKGTRVGVERGYGPRHAFNAQEGNEAVPGELPSPPEEELKLKRDSLGNLRPAMLTKMLGEELGGLTKEDVAKMAVGMLVGGEAEPLGGVGAVPKMARGVPRETPQLAATSGGMMREALNRYDFAPEHGGVPDLATDLTKIHESVGLSDPVAKALGDYRNDPVGYEKQLEMAARRYATPAKSEADLEFYKKGTKGVRHSPRTVTGRPKKIGEAPGFGPRHAENSKEGEDLTQVPTDTVPAMLTPREAVLNRNAAELAGRGRIEKLNEEGNALAKKGVDLAAGGDSDVGLAEILKTYQSGGDLTPEEILRVIAVLRSGGGGEKEPAVATAVPKYGEYHEELPALGNPNRAEGDSDVPSNAWGAGSGLMDRLGRDFGDPSKVGREAYEDFMRLLSQFGVGSKRGFEGMPRVSDEEMMRRYPGLKLQEGEDDTPYPMRLPPEGLEGLKLEQEQAQEELMRELEDRLYRRGVPPLRGLSEGEQSKDTGHAIEGYRVLARKGTSDMKQKPKQTKGGPQVAQQVPQFGRLPAPPQQQPRGGFYPPGMGLFQGGAPDVSPPIGSPNTQQAYGPAVQLSAPDLAALLAKAGQQQGLSATQIAGLTQAFQSFGGGGGGDSLQSGGYGTSPLEASGGFQGGISDIGYPPMIGPNMKYHADKGSTWVGAYDPAYLVERYARGTSSVPFR